MDHLNYVFQNVPLEYNNLGGRGLTSKLLWEEVDPRVHPLNKDNKVVISPGLLTGTTAPSTGRISIGSKSPLTGGIKESNAGGTASQYLAGHGIKALILEGKASEKHCWVLVVRTNKVEFQVMDELSMLGNYDTVSILKKKYGEDCSIMSIGPAGELCSSIATIAVTDLEDHPTRHAARGGLGAVVGSKGIKAIVITKPLTTMVKAVDVEAFRETAKAFSKDLISSKKALSTYGTALLVNVINSVGGFPTNNFSTGHNDEAENISGENLHKLCTTRGGATAHPCSRGCVIRCSNIFHDDKGSYVTSGLEYETIALLGSNCGLNNLDNIAELDRICDDIGIDTMDTGGAFGVAMEAGSINLGDFETMKSTLLSIATQDSFLGKLISHGAALTGKVLGVERVPTVKGQTIAAYDPRALKGTGVTYATTSMGGDHTAGNATPGRGGIDHRSPAGQIKLSKSLQINSMICDILGMCIFVGPVDETIPTLSSLVSSFVGYAVSTEDLKKQAREILKLEVDFNRLAGISSMANDLPLYFREEPLPNNGLVFDVPHEDLLNFSFSDDEKESSVELN